MIDSADLLMILTRCCANPIRVLTKELFSPHTPVETNTKEMGVPF
jgi:hypothetical protein